MNPYEIWVWLVREDDGREGAIAVVLPGSEQLGPMVLQARSWELAERVRPLAEAHGRATGRLIRLAHLLEV